MNDSFWGQSRVEVDVNALQASPFPKFKNGTSSQQLRRYADNGNGGRWPASADEFSNLQIRKITIENEGDEADYYGRLDVFVEDGINFLTYLFRR